MPTLTYLVGATLDGFIAGPDRTDPSGPDGFWPITAEDVDHVVAEHPETLPAAAREALGITADSRFGTDLAGCLYDEIDELVLKLSPLTISAGVPMFGDRGRFQPHGWQRRDVVLLPGGAVVASFARGGETAPQ